MSAESMTPGSTVRVSTRKLDARGDRERVDRLAVEEPLGIRVLPEVAGRRERHDVAVTMRTPGHDEELALGFLLTEGVLSRFSDVAGVRECEPEEPPGSVIEVSLVPGVDFDVDRFRRNVYTSSSCGICGRAAIERVRQHCESLAGVGPTLSRSQLWRLPAILRAEQAVFEKTGGLHAAGWFDRKGSLRRLREDVGRHNAVDKVIGGLLREGRLPAHDGLLMLSGRVSFELVQKAALAGIPIVAAVGAASSLAVELGAELGMTIIGFLRDGRCNVYTDQRRVAPSASGRAE